MPVFLSVNVRILTIANHLGSRGGLERTQLTNCRGLAGRGHRVDLVYVSAGDFFGDWRAFATTMTAVGGTLPRRGAPAGSTWAVARGVLAARKVSPEVVYVYRYWDVPFAAAVASMGGARLVYHLCLPPPSRVPRWLRVGLRRVDATLAVSEDTARRWVGTGLRSERTSIALTGIDLDHYVPAPAEARAATRRELQVDEGATLVLYAGRIGREKGVDVLVRAFGLLQAEIGLCHLVVVGTPSLGADPGDSERYLAELHALGGHLNVSWLPGRRDVLALLQASDIAVVPSLWPEPLSRSVMEPLACGVPVIATRTGGNPEILTGPLAQYLVDPGDPEALSRGLVRLHAWRQRDPELGERCRQAAESRLSLDDELDAIEAALSGMPQPAQRRAANQRLASPWRTKSPKDATSCG